MKDFYVYILKCNDNSYYVGHTDDIEKRMNEHITGQSESYVASRLPVKLVFLEACASRYEAIQAERKLKGWSRKKKELLIKSGWQAMKGYWRKTK